MENSRRPDFITDNSITRSAVIIEIKTPETKLLSSRQKRKEVYAPLSTLTSSIVQIQEQAERITQHINAELLESGQQSQTWTVHNISKIIIVGKTDEFAGDDQKIRMKSFEQFRNACANVTIITYDELLEKLRQLKRFLELHSMKE